ncbi:hypothetical protein [Tuberibacillus sp. Marseille-P3662]|uniref:hypothetical protein n=1 Tax=Tuberibacillus sp. Marseille-P3662 TaxID=1965358 RepID=UPI000A1CE3F8|nr:hypothetical protein [Tuberibacillus sp. Marseille-P3662]
MSVMIINHESLECLGKFFTLSMSEERAAQKIESYHKLNVENFNWQYDDNAPYNTAFDFFTCPLISPEQAFQTLKCIQYNCLEHGEDIDSNAFHDLKQWVKKIETNYKLSDQAIEKAAWG